MTFWCAVLWQRINRSSVSRLVLIKVISTFEAVSPGSHPLWEARHKLCRHADHRHYFLMPQMILQTHSSLFQSISTPSSSSRVDSLSPTKASSLGWSGKPASLTKPTIWSGRRAVLINTTKTHPIWNVGWAASAHGLKASSMKSRIRLSQYWALTHENDSQFVYKIITKMTTYLLRRLFHFALISVLL